MKRFTKLNFILSGIFVLLIALTFSSFSQAEEADDQKINVLESQMSQLIESQNELTLALSGVAGQGQQDMGPMDLGLEGDQNFMGDWGDGTELPPPYICTKDSGNWPSSNIYKENDWQMEAFYLKNGVADVGFHDLNGDGLSDRYYFYNGGTWRTSCVYLNTGSGWELTHGCQAGYDNDQKEWTFKGDCAQL